MVFFSIITGTAIDDNFSHPLLDFLIVTLGGAAIGAAIGFLTLALFKTVFNDALFEITAIIGSAYLTFYIAESLHWSGVIGLVTLGLLMAGRGKTRISPEVGHFLHEFWVGFVLLPVCFALACVCFGLALGWLRFASSWLWVGLGLLWDGFGSLWVGLGWLGFALGWLWLALGLLRVCSGLGCVCSGLALVCFGFASSLLWVGLGLLWEGEMM